LRDPTVKLGQEVLDIGQLRDRGIGNLDVSRFGAAPLIA